MTAEQYADELKRQLSEIEMNWRIKIAEAYVDGRITNTTSQRLLKDQWSKHVKLARKAVENSNKLVGVDLFKLEVK